MSAALIWSLIRNLAVPLALAAGLFWGGWRAGAGQVKEQCDQRERDIKLAADSMVIAGLQREAKIGAALATAHQQIEATSTTNALTLSDLSARNRQLLAARLHAQPAACRRGGGVPQATAAARSDDESAVAGDRLLSKAAGDETIDDAELADRLTESLRSCRQWVLASQRIFNRRAD